MPANELRAIARRIYGRGRGDDYREALAHLIDVKLVARKGRTTNAITFTQHALAAVRGAMGRATPRPTALKGAESGDLVLRPTVVVGGLGEPLATFVAAALDPAGCLALPHYRSPDSGLWYSRQSFRRAERESLFAGQWEVDIVNAWPTVVARRYGDRCPTWHRYVSDREAMIGELAALAPRSKRHDPPSLVRRAKAEVLRLLNGGALESPFDRVPWMVALRAEAKALVADLGLRWKGGGPSNFYNHLARSVAEWQQAMIDGFGPAGDGPTGVGLLIVDGCVLAADPGPKAEAIAAAVGFRVKVRRIDGRGS